MRPIVLLCALAFTTLPALATCPYGHDCPTKKGRELLETYQGDKSRYSPLSPTNPYATDAPRIYDSQGNYRGRLSTNRYDPDSTRNPYGQYGSRYSPDSINNPYGAGSPYSTELLYVVPSW